MASQILVLRTLCIFVVNNKPLCMRNFLNKIGNYRNNLAELFALFCMCGVPFFIIQLAFIIAGISVSFDGGTYKGIDAVAASFVLTFGSATGMCISYWLIVEFGKFLSRMVAKIL